MAKNKLPTWAAILIAGVIIVGMLAVMAVGGAAFFIYRHINTTVTPNENAEAVFTDARARFSGQQPLIEVRHGDDPVIHRELVPAEATSDRKIDNLHVLAYDPRERKLVRVSIPFWLLRLAPSKHFMFSDNGMDFDSDRVRLTVDDLERRGPGLVLDATDRRGSRVLVWTE